MSQEKSGTAARRRGGSTYLAEVVEDALEEDGGGDDDGADGGHGPRRRLVQRSRPIPAFAAAHLSAFVDLFRVRRLCLQAALMVLQ